VENKSAPFTPRISGNDEPNHPLSVLNSSQEIAFKSDGVRAVQDLVNA